MRRVFTLFTVALSTLCSSTLATPLRSRADAYTNPIKPGGGADPFVLKYGDAWYMTISLGSPHVSVFKTDDLSTWPTEGTTVYTPDDDWKEVWAPELHYVDGAFYIYVAMDHGDNADHRMYVLKGTSTTDPTQPFEFIGQVGTPDNNWAIDGTIFSYTDGNLYFVWSGWTNASMPKEQNLYIARMESPTNISSERVLLHEPTLDWQRSNDQGVNEGPEVLVHDGRTFLIYSSAGSWGPDYNLAIMGIDNNADPLVPTNWWVDDSGPIFARSDAASVFGPGHASYTADREGTPFVVYHATQIVDGGWANRSVRAQPFGWEQDGLPRLGEPVGTGVTITPGPQ